MEVYEIYDRINVAFHFVCVYTYIFHHGCWCMITAMHIFLRLYQHNPQQNISTWNHWHYITLYIPMGGNASPFIAYLYLSWYEYCYVTKVVKTDYALAKLLSYNCRYLDDICTVNLQYFGDIYDNTLLLEGSTCSHKQDTFLDLHIRVVDHKFITGICYKVDDFNFEVISYPFPQNNVHSMLGYSTYYSQLIRLFRLCNNINYFLFRAKFSYSNLPKRGCKLNLLLKYFKRFCLAYDIEGKYGGKFWSTLLAYAQTQSFCFLYYT